MNRCGGRLVARRLASRLAPFVLTLLLAPALAPRAAAQQEEPPAAPAEEAAPTYPDRSQVGPRYLRLVDDAVRERRRLEELGDVADLAEDLELSRQRSEELVEGVEEVLTSPRRDTEELLAARQAVARHRDELASLVERASLRIAEVDRIRDGWLEAQDLWSGWRDSLRQADALGEFAADFQRAEAVIAGVLADAEATVAELAEAQGPLRELQERSLEVMARLDGNLATRRAALSTRDAPALVSGAYLAELKEAERWQDMAEAVSRLHWPDAAYFQGELPALAATLLLFLAAFLVARHFRRLFPLADHRWRILLSHPVAIGLFVATAFSPLLFRAPPALWRLALLTVLAASAAVLTSGTFRNGRKRRVVYVVAAFFVLVLGLDTLALPSPAYRAFTLLATGLVLPFLLATARRERASMGRATGFVRLLQAGVCVLGLVLLAQVAGYASLARWLLESALTTAFIAFTTVFLLRLGKGALRAALRRPDPRVPAGRRVTLRRVGHELSPHLARGLDVVLVVVAGLYALTVWGVFDAPWEGWRRVIELGVGVGDHRITVAQVLLGVLALYLAFAASRVTRALVGEELGRRREVEPGVADSVSTLAHYALMILGLFVALSALGFDLSTFAILAGALGVGIGFGLQTMVNNFLSGLVLLFERPVRVGDVVVIDGQWATIRKIGLRATVVTTFDLAEVIVPNGDLTSEKVTNWTLTDSKTRILLQVGVAYGSDVDAVFRILHEVLAGDPRVAEDPPPVVHFNGFGESSLDFVLRVWVLEISERLNVKSDLLREIDRRFREEGITIPFPQRDVHLHTDPGAAAAGPID